MYAVIFKAKIKQFDDEYEKTANLMQSLAKKQYGCTDFISVNEGDDEISISYWKSLDDIKQWKQNAQHLTAQATGKNKWYQSYKIEVVEVMREYSSH